MTYIIEQMSTRLFLHEDLENWYQQLNISILNFKSLLFIIIHIHFIRTKGLLHSRVSVVKISKAFIKSNTIVSNLMTEELLIQYASFCLAFHSWVLEKKWHCINSGLASKTVSKMGLSFILYSYLAQNTSFWSLAKSLSVITSQNVRHWLPQLNLISPP